MTSPDRIRSAIDHIKTALDVDEWAALKARVDRAKEGLPG